MTNKKVLLLCIHIIIVAFFFNMFFYEKAKINDPLFIEHYYEKVLSEGNSFTLYFISNKNDNRTIISIDFPQLNNENPIFTLDNQKLIKNYGNYNLNEITLECRGNYKEIQSSISVEDIEVVFSDNTYLRQNAGKFVFSTYKTESRLVDDFEFGGSSENSSSVKIKALEDVELEKIYNDLDNTMYDILFTDVDGKDVYPYLIKKDQIVEITNRFEINKNDKRRFNSYDISKRAYFKSKDGKVQELELYNIKYKPVFTTSELYKYVEERGKFNE